MLEIWYNGAVTFSAEQKEKCLKLKINDCIFLFLPFFSPTRGIFIPLRGEENGFCIEMRQLRKEMKQETFTDIEYSFRKKRAKSRNNRKKLDYSFYAAKAWAEKTSDTFHNESIMILCKPITQISVSKLSRTRRRW